MKKWLLIVGAVGVVLYLAVALSGLLGGSNGSERLSAIDIEIQTEPGQQLFMDEEAVRKELAQMKLNLEGAPIDSIDINKIEQHLRSNPIFDNAEVYLARNTGKLKIRLSQQAPFFLVQSGDSTYYVTHNRGIVPLNPKYAVYAPVVSGEVSKEMARGEMYDLMQVIDADPYFKHYFGHYYVDPTEGIVLTPRAGRAKIYMGREGDWQQMLAKLKRFNQEVIPRKGWQAFEYLRLNFGDQVVAYEVGKASAPTSEAEV